MSNPGTADKGTEVPDTGVVTPATSAEDSSSVAATEGAVPPTADAPAADGAEGGSVGSTSAPASPQTPDLDSDKDPAAWKAKKYDKVLAKLRDAEAALAAAKADPAAAGAGLSQADVDRQAQALASRAEFNRRCNEVAAGAKASYPDFTARIGNLQQLVTPGDQEEAAAYGKLIEACLEVGPEAGRIIYELGGNLDEANRIMNLSPVKQGMALAALAAKKGEAEPSSTPKPITPVGQRGATGELIDPADAAKADKLSSKEWFARRQADIDKKRAAGQRIW